MRTFLVINDGVVVDIIEKEGDFSDADTSESFDTVTDDYSNSYVIGDVYTVEDYAVRNNTTQPIASSLPKKLVDIKGLFS